MKQQVNGWTLRAEYISEPIYPHGTVLYVNNATATVSVFNILHKTTRVFSWRRLRQNWRTMNMPRFRSRYRADRSQGWHSGNSPCSPRFVDLKEMVWIRIFYQRYLANKLFYPEMADLPLPATSFDLVSYIFGVGYIVTTVVKVDIKMKYLMKAYIVGKKSRNTTLQYLPWGWWGLVEGLELEGETSQRTLRSCKGRRHLLGRDYWVVLIVEGEASWVRHGRIMA